MSLTSRFLLQLSLCSYVPSLRRNICHKGTWSPVALCRNLPASCELRSSDSRSARTPITQLRLHRNRAMSTRDELEIAVRRTLTFYLEGECSTNGSDEWELLVSALLDAAETGTLRMAPDVEAQFDDYLPDASLPSTQRDGLYDDLLR